MKIETKGLKIIEDKPGCLAYDCEGMYYIELKAGTVASDHIHEEPETIYLVSGTARVEIDNQIQEFTGPVKFTLPGGIHHKVSAITDSIALEVK
tara:strand:- start:294 stop:575 length:282 start_codon:yes stop_codon:yes gene_type:complete